MRTPIASVTVALGLLALAGCDAVQPKPYCRVQPSRYAARYALQGNTQGNCAGKILTGEIVHLNFYRNKDNYADGAPAIGIEPDTMAAMGKMMGAMGMEFSFGRFLAAKPAEDDVCRAPELSEAMMTAGPVALAYKWSNFGMMNHPLFNAVNWGADLVRKDGDCTATYKVTGVFPAVYCGDGTKTVMKPDGTMGTEPDPTTGNAKEGACDPKNSGLHPGMDYACDVKPDGTGTRLCLAVKDFPSRK